MIGRPTKLTPERHKRIVELIARGNFATVAAQAGGVTESTFYRWMRLGKEATAAIEKWEERVEDWNDMNDRQRRSQGHLRPNEKEAPSEDDLRFSEFFQQVKSAEALAENRAIGSIQEAADKGTWQAAAWYLERKYKDRWGRHDKVDHGGQISHQIGVGASPAEIEAARLRLHQARAGELTEGEDPGSLPELIEGDAEEILT